MNGGLWPGDSGAHRCTTTMRGAGIAPAPIRLLRVSLDDPRDHEAVEVCGIGHGTVTNPPLYDERRRVAVAYHSGNGVVRAFRFGARLEPLWRRELSHAAHMIQFPDTGELVLHDFNGPRFARTRLAQAIGGRWPGPARSPRVRRALARRSGDDVVLVDVETAGGRLSPPPGPSRRRYPETSCSRYRYKGVGNMTAAGCPT